MFFSPLLAIIGSVPQMLIVGAVILLLFGGKKIHQLARGISRSPLEFLKGKREHEDPDRTLKDD